MTIADYLKAIPEILLYIAPGFVSIKIEEAFLPRKTHNRLDTVLFSILYSFIVGIVYQAVFAVIFSSSNEENNVVIKQAVCLLLGVALGLFLVKIPSTRIGKGMRNIFGEGLSSASSVWVEAMKNPTGAWATVYLKNNLVFTGALNNYTMDPDEEIKEVLLSRYRLMVRKDSMVGLPKEFCVVIEDYHEDANATVFLRQDMIESIVVHRSNTEN